MASIEARGGQVCVDFFHRRDGTWGFEEYRRDPEDPRGWSAIGYHVDLAFPDEATAYAAAAESVAWLGSQT